MLTQPTTGGKTRVGFVVHVMQVAGAEVLVTQLIDRLRDEIEPTIFCLDSLGLLGERMEKAGVPVVVLNRSPGIDLSLPRRFAKELSRRKVDVVHAHQYTPFFYSALAKLCGAWRAKIVFTEHGRHYPDIVSWKRKFANRTLFSRLSYARTACCDFSGQAAERNDGFQPVETIRNGVDLASFASRGTPTDREQLRRRLGLESDRLYVGCVARFHPVKDHPMLLRAWKSVQANFPQARLLLIGDGPEKDRMIALAKSLGILESVSFWGVRHDVAEILQAIDVFSLTSVSEASSLTLLEAMASECPVVITDVGGNGEHVTHGVEGWLVPRHDHEKLAAQLQQLLEQPELRKKMAFGARQRVEKEFSLEQTVERYRSLYVSAAQA
jgi:glycosyltransferase involved in cell wall biosynthesis